MVTNMFPRKELIGAEPGRVTSFTAVTHKDQKNTDARVLSVRYHMFAVYLEPP